MSKINPLKGVEFKNIDLYPEKHTQFMGRNISRTQEITVSFFHKLIKLFTASAHEELLNNVSPGLHNPYLYGGIIAASFHRY